MNQYDNVAQYQYQQQYPPKGKIITGMIMGIVSVSMWWYPFIFSIPCIIFGIVALSLASGCKNAPQKFRGMVKAARITGTIGLILSLISTIVWVVIIIGLGNMSVLSYMT